MKISLLSRSGPEILQSMLKGDEEQLRFSPAQRSII